MPLSEPRPDLLSADDQDQLRRLADDTSPYRNEITGEELRVLARGPSQLTLHFTSPAGFPGAGLHYHHKFTETFVVLEGELEMKINSNDNVIRLKAGDSFAVPPLMLHAFRNSSDAVVKFVTLHNPPLRFEHFIRTWYGLSNEGRARFDGMPKNPVAVALTLDWSDTYIAGVPEAIQRPLVQLLGLLGRVTGLAKALQRHFQDALQHTH